MEEQPGGSGTGDDPVTDAPLEDPIEEEPLEEPFEDPVEEQAEDPARARPRPATGTDEEAGIPA